MVGRINSDDFCVCGQRRKLGHGGAGCLEPSLVAPCKHVAHFPLVVSLCFRRRVVPGEVLGDEFAREARGAEEDEVEVAHVFSLS